ncbi:MAG: hypothetical protein WAW30_04985 [Patescibacteria group bacterium]
MVQVFSDIGRILSEVDYFRYLKSWNKSLFDLTSDAITLNFCFLLYKDYIEKGRPI